MLALTACVNPTNVIKPLAEKDQGARNIQSVKVTYSDLSNGSLLAADEQLKIEAKESDDPENIQYRPLKETLEVIVSDYLEKIDSDSTLNTDIEIEIDNLKLANAAVVFFLGDADQLAGTVRVYDAETRELLSEMYIDVVDGNGGLIGLAMRGTNPRGNLSSKFAAILGKELGYETN